MSTKPKAKGGATATIPSIGYRFRTTNAADVTNDVASRAKTAALAEAKKIIRSGGTEAEAIVGAKEAARRALEEGMRGSSPPTPAGATITDATAVARGQMGLPPRVPTNVKGGGRDNFYNIGRNMKDKTKNVEMKTKTKANTNTATTAAGTNKRWKVKDRKESRGIYIELGHPSRLPKVAVRQQVAPEPPTESRDDVQSSAKRQEATKDEMASPGRSDDCKRETEISRVSSIQTYTIKDSSIANEVKCEVEIINESSIDERTAGRNEDVAYSDMNRIGLELTQSTQPTLVSANTSAVAGVTGDILEKKDGETVVSGGAAAILGGRMGLPPLGPTNVKGGGRGGIFSKFLNMGRNTKEKTKNVQMTTNTKTNTATAAAGTNKGRKAKDGKGERDLHIEQHAAPEPPTESRDDVQPLAERQEATTDEMASPGRSDNCNLETGISKGSSIEADVIKDSSIADEAKREVETIKDSIADEDKRETVIPKYCGIHSHHRLETPLEEVSDGSISLGRSQSLTMQDSSASATSGSVSFESRMNDDFLDNIPSDDMDLMDIVLHAVSEALFPKNANNEGLTEKKADARTNGDLIEELDYASSSPGIVSYLHDSMVQWCQCVFERGEQCLLNQSFSIGSSDDGRYFDVACAAPPASKAAIPASKDEIPASKSSDSCVDPNDQMNDTGVLDTTNDGTHHDSSFVNATTKRLLRGRHKSKKNTSSKGDYSTAKSGTLETISNNDIPRVQSTARSLISDKLKGKKNTSSKMADFNAKSSTIETISTKDTLPEKTGMSSLVTGSANDEPASSRVKNRIKNTAAGLCYFPPGGRKADVDVFKEVNDREILVLKDEYNGGLDGGNVNRKETGADTMGLQDDYDPNWRDNVADFVGTKGHPVNKQHMGQFQRQQNHRTQLPGQMHRPHSVAAPPIHSGHFPPLSSSMMQNNGERYRMSPANDKYCPHVHAIVGQWQNPQYAPDSEIFKWGQQQHHPQIPFLREPTFKINADLSIESTDERHDRYAGMVHQEVGRQDIRTLVDSGPPHSSVGGMAGSAMGGYGSINMTHNGMMGQQGYQSHAWAQAQITLPPDYNDGDMQYYTTSARGRTQTMLV